MAELGPLPSPACRSALLREEARSGGGGVPAVVGGSAGGGAADELEGPASPPASAAGGQCDQPPDSPAPPAFCTSRMLVERERRAEEGGDALAASVADGGGGGDEASPIFTLSFVSCAQRAGARRGAGGVWGCRTRAGTRAASREQRNGREISERHKSRPSLVPHALSRSRAVRSRSLLIQTSRA